CKALMQRSGKPADLIRGWLIFSGVRYYPAETLPNIPPAEPLNDLICPKNWKKSTEKEYPKNRSRNLPKKGEKTKNGNSQKNVRMHA
ncbi:hypothetical protein ACFGZW_10715, partial [Pasteurella multocida]